MRMAIPGILILLLLLGVGLYLRDTVLKEQSLPESAPEVVYVNMDKLAAQAPQNAYAAVSHKNTVRQREFISEIARRNQDMPVPGISGYKVPVPDYGKLRKVFAEDEKDRIRTALGELADRREAALELRCTDLRTVLMRNQRNRAESEIFAIRQDTAERLRQIADSYTAAQINAEMKLASVSLRKNDLEDPNLPERIEFYKAELERIKKERDAALAAAESDMEEKVRDSFNALMAEVDSDVSEYERAELAEILRANREAEEIMTSEIHKLADPKSFGISMGEIEKLPMYRPAVSTAKINDTTDEMRARIRRDLERTVKIRAAKENLTVTFDKSKSDKDYTKHFAEEIFKPLVDAARSDT